MANLAIIGNGGHAKVIKDMIFTNKCNFRGFYDDQHSTSEFYLGSISKISECKDSIICAIGSNEIRKRIATEYPKLYWDTIIHPSAILSTSFFIGMGSMICAGAIIQPDTSIGRHCIINTKVSIDHDCLIGDFVHIAPGSTLCGNVKVGELTFIGAGTTVKNGITIGKNVTIGCGSNVVKDIPDNCVAYGNPCKVIKFK